MGNASYIKIFLIVCIQFALRMDCQFMKKKDTSSHSIFHNLTWKFSAFYNFSEKIQVLNIKLKYL